MLIFFSTLDMITRSTNKSRSFLQKSTKTMILTHFTKVCNSLLQVGPRLTKDRERFPPNNILLMLAGAGLLWLGWTGFNGGDPYVASMDAALAVLNTHVCTATSLLTWLLLDIIFFRKPSVIGAVQGMITGLVCITPAAGNLPENL